MSYSTQSTTHPLNGTDDPVDRMRVRVPMMSSELRASYRPTSVDAPDSTRPRIGSGVSSARVNRLCRTSPPHCHRGTPRPILSRYLPKPRRVNRRAAGPDPEPRSPAPSLSLRTKETPFSCRREPGTGRVAVMAGQGAMTRSNVHTAIDQTARTSLRQRGTYARLQPPAVS